MDDANPANVQEHEHPIKEAEMELNEALRVLTLLTGEQTQSAKPSAELPEKVLIRTVTHYHVGRVVSQNDRWIVLDEAAWVADTGRFSEALTKGTLGEVEPFPGPVWVAVGAIVDVAAWTHDLLRQVK